MFTKSKWEDTFLYKAIFNERGEVGEDSDGDSSDSSDNSAESSDDSSEVSPEGDSEVVEASNSIESSPEGDSTVEVKAETEAELEKEIEGAIEDGASEEDVKDMIRSFTLKVDGKEFTRELDLNDEEAVTRELQLAAKGRKSTQELAELKKLYTQEIERLQKDPFGVLKELNPEFDPLDLSASYIDKILKENEMSPEEKAEKERDAKMQQILEENERLKKAAEERVHNEKMQALEQEIQSDISAAIESDSDLVNDDETVALVLENLMYASSKPEFADYKAKDVLPQVKKQLQEQFRRAAGRLKTPAALKAFMGKDVTDMLREERLEQAKQQVANVNNIKQGSKPAEKKDENVEKINLSSMFK